MHSTGLETRKRLRAEATLEDFVIQSWPAFDGAALQNNWHVGAISDQTQLVFSGEKRFVVIVAPPRNTKTSITSVCAVPWAWTHSPNLRAIYASHSEDLAREHSRNSRKILRSRWYRDRWGEVFSLDKLDQDLITNDKHGARQVRTMDSTTGFGANIIVVDDPHDHTRVSTAGDRRQKIQFFRGLITRLNDPKHDCILVVGQRTHERDLQWFAVEELGFEVVCLPLEYDPQHKYVWPGDPRMEAGEPLHPEREGKEEIEAKKAKMGSRKYAAQCQGDPLSEAGGSFEKALWGYVKKAPSNLVRVRFHDLARTDPDLQEIDWKPSSTTSVRAGIDPDTEIIYIEDVTEVQMTSSDQQNFVCNVARNDGPDVEQVIEQESASAGHGIIVWYSKAIRGYRVTGWPVGRVMNDAEPLIGRSEIGMVKLVEGHWNERFIDTMRGFPHAADDDIPVCAIGAHARLIEKLEEKLPQGTPHDDASLYQ